MAASFTKSILKMRTSKGAKSGTDAEWGLGWVSHRGLEDRRTSQTQLSDTPKPSASKPGPRAGAQPQKRSNHKHQS